MLQALRGLESFVSTISDELGFIADLNQSMELLGKMSSLALAPISSLTGGLQSAVMEADNFNKQILQSQIAFTLATKEIDAFGNEVVSFADRLSSSKTTFKKLAQEIEIETQTVSGLTSSRLYNVLNEVVQESSSILGQYSDKYASNTSEIFKKLTANLASTFSLLGSPDFQDPQEVRALLTGNVNDPNAFVASKLNISQAEVASAQASGKFIDLLIEKTQGYREASTLASNSLENLTSNLKEIGEVASKALGQPLLDSLTKAGGELFSTISSTKNNSINNVIGSVSKGVLAIDKDIERTSNKLQYSTSPTETASISQNLNNLNKQREDIIKQGEKKLKEIGVENPQQQIKKALNEDKSLAGREAINKARDTDIIPERTIAERITGMAATAGEGLAKILDGISSSLLNFGKILDSLNIAELLEGFGTGFIKGLTETISTVTNVISGAINIISGAIAPFSGIIESFLNIDSSTLFGVILGVTTALGLLSKAITGVGGAFLALTQKTIALTAAMGLNTGAGGASAISAGLQSFLTLNPSRGGGIFNYKEIMAALAGTAMPLAAGSGAGVVSPAMRAMGVASATRQGIQGAELAAIAAGNAMPLTMGRQMATGQVPMVDRLGGLVGALVPALTTIASIAAVIGVAVVAIRGINIMLSKLASDQGPFGALIRWAKPLRDFISIFDVIGWWKGNKEEAKGIISNSVKNQLATPGREFKNIGGTAGYNKLLSSGKQEDTDRANEVAKSFVEANNLIKTINEGTDEELRAAGYGDVIPTIKDLRKDKSFQKDMQAQSEQLSKQYKDMTGKDLSGTFEAANTKFQGSLAKNLYGNMSKLDKYTDFGKTSQISDSNKEEDINQLSKSLDNLISNDLIGTESLQAFSSELLKASQNEALTAEHRMLFMDMYNKAISKEQEITERLIKTQEALLDINVRTGKTGAATEELERLKIEYDRIKNEFNTAQKKNTLEGIKQSDIRSSAEKDIKEAKGESAESLNKIPALEAQKQKLMKEREKLSPYKDPKKIEDLNKQFTDSLYKEYEQEVEVNGRVYREKNKIANPKFIDEVSKVLANSPGLVNNSDARSYLGGINGILTGNFIKQSIDAQKEGNLASSLMSSQNFEKYREVFKTNKDAFEGTDVFKKDIPNLNENVQKAIKDYMSTGKANLSILDAGQIKEFEGQIINMVREVREKGKLNINLQPYVDPTRFNDEIDNLTKEIDDLASKVIIETDVDSTKATEKLKALQSEREKLKQKIEDGEGGAADFSKATSLDRDIALEKNAIAISQLTQQKKDLEEQLGAATPDQQPKILSELKSVDNKLKVIDRRSGYIQEAKNAEAKIAEIEQKKTKTTDSEQLKKLEAEKTSFETIRDRADSKANVDGSSKLEDANRRIKGSEELKNLSDAELLSIAQRKIGIEKLLELEKKLTKEKQEQERLSVNISQASLALAKTQLKAAGTFEPELFDYEIKREEMNVARQNLSLNRSEERESRIRLDESFKTVGGGDIEKTLRELPNLGSKAFKQEIERLSGRKFDSSNKALEFAEGSVNMGVNIDRILNAKKIDDTVKKSFKYIYKQDLPDNIDLKTLQTKLYNTRGGMTTANEKATQIGSLRADVQSNAVSYKQAMEEAKALKIDLAGVADKQSLINKLAMEYGKALGTDEITKNLDANLQSKIKIAQAEAELVNLSKAQIDNMVRLTTEEGKRINRLEQIKDLMGTMGTDSMSESEMAVNQNVRNLENTMEEFKATSLYKTPEVLEKLVNDPNVDISKVQQMSGISQSDFELYQKLLNDINAVTESALGRINELLDKRLSMVQTLNAAGEIGLGPNAGMSSRDTRILEANTKLENALTSMYSGFQLDMVEDVALNKDSLQNIDPTENIGNISNVIAAAKEKMDAYVMGTAEGFARSSEKISTQIGLITNLKSAYDSLSQANNIYANVVNRKAGEQIQKFQEQLQGLSQQEQSVTSDPSRAKAREEYNKYLEENKNSPLQGKWGSEYNQLYLAAGQDKVDEAANKRADIERQIAEIKKKQLEYEQTQALIALKRQEIENKIEQLKNKAAGQNLYAERAKIIGMKDGEEKTRLLAANTQQLGINKTEGQLLQVAGNVIKESYNLQKNTTSSPQDINNALDKSNKAAKQDLSNLDSISNTLDSTISNTDLDATAANMELDSLQSSLDGIKTQVLESLPPGSFEAIQNAIGNTGDKVADLIAKVSNDLAGMNISQNMSSLNNNVIGISQKLDRIVGSTPKLVPQTQAVPQKPTSVVPQVSTSTKASVQSPAINYGTDGNGNLVISNVPGSVKSPVGNIKYDNSGGVPILSPGSKMDALRDLLNTSKSVSPKPLMPEVLNPQLPSVQNKGIQLPDNTSKTRLETQAVSDQMGINTNKGSSQAVKNDLYNSQSKGTSEETKSSNIENLLETIARNTQKEDTINIPNPNDSESKTSDSRLVSPNSTSNVEQNVTNNEIINNNNNISTLNTTTTTTTTTNQNTQKVDVNNNSMVNTFNSGLAALNQSVLSMTSQIVEAIKVSNKSGTSQPVIAPVINMPAGNTASSVIYDNTQKNSTEFAVQQAMNA